MIAPYPEGEHAVQKGTRKHMVGFAAFLGAATLAVAAIIPNLGLATSLATPELPHPADGAFPEAEVIHVVYQQRIQCDECPSGADLTAYTTETWINRVSGDVVAKTTDEAGTLRRATTRRGTTLTEYYVERPTGLDP